MQLSYSAPATCPDAAAYRAQVATRTTRARPASAGERATVLTVVVQDVAGGNHGTLELRAPDGATAMREVSAADCAQVVAALALVTALAIDPNASTSTAVPAQPAPRVQAPPLVERARMQAKPPTPPPIDEGASSRWRFGLGLLVEALGGVAPEPAFFPRPFAQVTREIDAPFGFALRLSGGRAHGEVVDQGGRASFTLLAGRLEGCPLRVSATPRLALSACVPLDAGRLEAAGSGFTPSQRVARPWLSAGAIARVEWQLVDVLVLEAAGELFFPIVRDRFFVGNDATLHRVPKVAGGLAVGLGVRIP
ncbi:MAG TPA: hypothetical protein VK509_08765 [Polyangiales bacterium]|nr:hypothetical protein [Polyangiales bacterium]